MKNIKILLLICVLFLSSCWDNQEKENINSENTNSWSIAIQNIVPIEDKENPIIKLEDCNADNQVNNSGKKIIRGRLPWWKGDPTRSEIQADSDTFEMLDWGYAKDKNAVFYRWSKIKWIDIDSFKVFGKSSYSKDKNNIYYRSGKIENVDSNTFEVLKWWYAKDKNYVYFDWEILEHNNSGYLYWDTSNSVDSKTFEVLSYCWISKEDHWNIINYEIINNYSKNKDWVYYKWKEIKWADPETFVISSIGYAKDKNAVYLDWGKFKDADPKTFQVINKTLSKDKDNIYYIQWYYDDCEYCSSYGNKEYKVIPTEPNTFEILNDEYSKDKNNVYYLWNIVENSDPSSFEILDKYYAKDKNNIYFGFNNWDKPFILEWTNSENFKVFSLWYAKDEKNIYYMWIKTNIVDFINNVKVFNNEYIENNNKIYFKVGLKDLENDWYYDFLKVDWVNINTFEALDYHYAKDKNSIYFAWNKISNNVDIDSFNVIHYDYTEDKNNCYKGSEVVDYKECENAKCFYKDICPQKEELFKNEQIKNLLPEDADIESIEKIDFENDWKDEYVIELKSNIAYMEENWWDTDWLFYWYYVLAMDESNKRNKVHEESYNWMTIWLDFEQMIINHKKFLMFTKYVDWTWAYFFIKLFRIENWENIILDVNSSSIKEWLKPYLLDWEGLYKVGLNWTSLDSDGTNPCDWKWMEWVNITYDLTYENWKLGVKNVKRDNYYAWFCFWWYKIKWVDEETFKVLSKHYAQDKDNCYKDNKIVDKSECENIIMSQD